MPRSRSAKRQIRETLRLKWEAGLSGRQISMGSGLSRPTVAKYVGRAKAYGLGWPLPASLNDAQLRDLIGFMKLADVRIVCGRTKTSWMAGSYSLDCECWVYG